MDSTELKSLQAPLKEQYKEDPETAVITLKAAGSVGEDISCSVETGRALTKAGLHPATGGDGAYACSGDMLLQALVACAGVTLQAVATSIGIEVYNGFISAEGDLDVKGTLGVSKEVPVGFKHIRLFFDLDTNATAEQLESLEKLTKRYCVVYQTIANGASISSEVKHS